MAIIKEVILSEDYSENEKTALRVNITCNFTHEEINREYYIDAVLYEKDNTTEASNENKSDERILHLFKWEIGEFQNRKWYSLFKKVKAVNEELKLEIVNEIDENILNEDPGTEIIIENGIPPTFGLRPYGDEFYVKARLYIKYVKNDKVTFFSIDSKESEVVTGTYGTGFN